VGGKEGVWAISKKKSHTTKTAKKNMPGEPWRKRKIEQVISTIQVLCLNFFKKYTWGKRKKKILAQAIALQKKSCSRKLFSPPAPQINNGPSLSNQ